MVALAGRFGPTGIAVRTGGPTAANDIRTDPGSSHGGMKPSAAAIFVSCIP